jgi:hypothetical protein
MPHATSGSPNIGNLYIGRGIVSIQMQGEVTFSDAGNVTLFEFQVKPTILPHYSSRVSVRIKDFTAVTELDATINMSMEEFTARNMALAILGDVASSPATGIQMFAVPQLFGAVQFVGTNSIGAQWEALFPLVQFSPNKVVSLIGQGSGSWGAIDLQVDVLKDTHTGEFAVFISNDIVTSPGQTYAAI